MVTGYEMKVNFVGQVVDSSSGEALKDITVNVTPPNSDEVIKINTDELGYFQFKNMTIGKAGGIAKSSSGGLATVTINIDGYKPFAKKYAIEGLAAMGSAISTTDIGAIKLEKE